MATEHGYRDAKIKPYCSQCGTVGGVGVCVRCRQSLCDAHLHAEDERCGTCEREQERRLTKRSHLMPLLFALLILQLVFVLNLQGPVSILAAVLTIAMAVGVTATADWLVSRRRFLNERVQRSERGPGPQPELDRSHCVSCGKETHRTCPFCEKPYCGEHLQSCDCQDCVRCGTPQHRILGKNERCKQCEAEYRDKYSMLQPAAALFWLFALALGAMAMRPGSSFQTSLLVGLAVGSSGMITIALLRLVCRRRFLGERKRHARQ